jgi:hypothetical protein
LIDYTSALLKFCLESVYRDLCISSRPLKTTPNKPNRYQRDKKRKLCKRRAAIEPIIGHLKSDFRLSRNLLKGQVGDEINVLMAESVYRDLCISSRPLKTTPNKPKPPIFPTI